MGKPLIHWVPGDSCVNHRWEEAYRRFETPSEVRAKFVRRLDAFGWQNWDRDARLLELFCGNGFNLEVLESKGFNCLKGVDLSPRLLSRYEGTANVYVGDARNLLLEPGSIDIVLIQGGLHHLPQLPEDLDATLASVHKVMNPNGRFYVVEPWLTPFLRLVHFCAERTLLRKLWSKLDAFQIMTEEERATYENWLSQPKVIRELLEKYFHTEKWFVTRGKLLYQGRPKVDG